MIVSQWGTFSTLAGRFRRLRNVLDACTDPSDRIETLTPDTTVKFDMSDEAVSPEEVVNPEEVRHVAALARVDVDDDDVERFAAQFADILAYFESLDTVPEVDRKVELTNVMRRDEEGEPLETGEALRNAEDSEDGYFKGPNVS